MTRVPNQPEPLSLTESEARERARLLTVHRYDLELDLTGLLSGDALRSRSTIRFAAPAGADTFVDCVAEAEKASLNGTALPTGAPEDGRIKLTGLAAENTLDVVCVQRRTSSAQGVHRSVDPADGEVYVWTSLAPDDARVVFACFDQPDLKAVFGITVTAPAGWTVTSNSGDATVTDGPDGTRVWVFPDTPPLSTYLPVVNAGPFHELRRSRGDHDLGLYARRSLTAMLERDADELFELTATGLEFFAEQFGMPFPQRRYDQVFVPELGGAMENYGCVTWSDRYVYRDPPSYADRMLRARTLLHEMSHMWFGDMVTMRWWDDVWLNESFADWACSWAATRCTEFTDAWADVLVTEKRLGYAADLAPTAHPVYQPVPDVATGAASFDDITYFKGAAVLKQLVVFVGEEAFLRGLRSYFDRHAWGCTTRADLVSELERASGRDLGDWVDGWLRTAGVDVISLTLDETGAVLHTRSPGGRPPLGHRLDVGVYVDEGDALVQRALVPVELAGQQTPVELPAGDLRMVNDGDLTFASVRPDPGSLDRLLQDGGRLPNALTRALALSTAWDMLMAGEIGAAGVVSCGIGVLDRETAPSVVEPMLGLVTRAADAWSSLSEREALLTEAAEVCTRMAADPAHTLAAIRALAVCATTPAQLDELAARATTPDLRWRRLGRLAELGLLDDAEVEQVQADDPDPDSWVSALRARAASPDDRAKRLAWQATVVDGTVPPGTFGRMGRAFWRRGQDELLAPYAEEFAASLRLISEAGMLRALELSTYMFPTAGADRDFCNRVLSAAGAAGVSPLVRQNVGQGADELARMLVARELVSEL